MAKENVRRRPSVQPEVSTAIDGSYYKGVDRHGQRTVIGVARPTGDWFSQRAVHSPRGMSPTLRGNQNDPAPRIAISFTNPHNPEEERKVNLGDTSRAVKPPYGNQQPLILRWQNLKDGVVIDEIVPTLRSSGGTDIRKKPAVIKDFRIRRLTPVECERLQGFPEIEEDITLEFIDNSCPFIAPQKNSAVVENPSLRLPNSVGSVEKTKRQESAPYVEQSTPTKHQRSRRPAASNVHISYVDSTIKLYSQGKLHSSVNSVEERKKSLPPIAIEDFVLQSVGMNTTLKRIIHSGKEASLLNGRLLIHHQNGKTIVKLYGKEIMQHVENVVNGTLTIDEFTKYIISDPSNMKPIEQKLITLFYSALLVITGYIPKQTLKGNSFSINVSERHGWTQWGLNENGERVKISDTQRYKCLGNAVTVNVIEFLGHKIMDSMGVDILDKNVKEEA